MCLHVYLFPFQTYTGLKRQFHLHVRLTPLTFPECSAGGLSLHIEDLHLVLLALNLSILDADILKMVQQVRLMLFLLNIVDHPMSFILLST